MWKVSLLRFMVIRISSSECEGKDAEIVGLREESA